MNECALCKGKGFYEEPNYRLEIMETVECLDCLAEENYRDSIEYDTSILLSKISPQKLAQLVAQLLVNSMIMEGGNSLQRLDGMVQGKNTMNVLALAETMIKGIKK